MHNLHSDPACLFSVMLTMTMVTGVMTMMCAVSRFNQFFVDPSVQSEENEAEQKDQVLPPPPFLSLC